MSNYTQNKELKKWESDPHMLCLSHATYSEKNWVKQSERQQTCTTSLREKNIFYTNFNFRSVLHAATITLHTILLSVCASSSFLYIFFSSTSDIYFLCVNKQKYSNLFIKKIEKKNINSFTKKKIVWRKKRKKKSEIFKFLSAAHNLIWNSFWHCNFLTVNMIVKK